MTSETRVRTLAGSKFWFFRFQIIWWFNVFRAIYTHISIDISSPTWSSGWALSLKPWGFWFDPESEVSGAEGDAPGTTGGWMTVLMKSQGRLTGLSSSWSSSPSVWLRKKKMVFTQPARYLSHGGPFYTFMRYIIIIYKYFIDL